MGSEQFPGQTRLENSSEPIPQGSELHRAGSLTHEPSTRKLGAGARSPMSHCHNSSKGNSPALQSLCKVRGKQTPPLDQQQEPSVPVVRLPEHRGLSAELVLVFNPCCCVFHPAACWRRLIPKGKAHFPKEAALPARVRGEGCKSGHVCSYVSPVDGFIHFHPPSHLGVCSKVS